MKYTSEVFLAAEVVETIATAELEIYLTEIVFILLLVFFYIVIDGTSICIDAVAR